MKEFDNNYKINYHRQNISISLRELGGGVGNKKDDTTPYFSLLLRSVEFFANKCSTKDIEDSTNSLDKSKHNNIIAKIINFCNDPHSNRHDCAIAYFVAGVLYAKSYCLEEYEKILLKSGEMGFKPALLTLGEKYLEKSEKLRFEGKDEESHAVIQKANGFLKKIGFQYMLKPEYIERICSSVTPLEDDFLEESQDGKGIKRKVDESWEDKEDAKRQNRSDKEFGR